MIANAPADDLVITPTTEPGVEVSIAGIDAVSGEQLTLDSAEPGTEVSVVVSNAAGDSLTYTLLYLPADFPEFSVNVNEPTASQDPIYVTPWYGEEIAYVVKLDNQGVPLFYSGSPPPRRMLDFKKHPGGLMSFAQESARSLADADQVVLNEDFEEIARLHTKNLGDTDHHDFVILPNGNYGFLSYVPEDRDATEYGLSAEQPVLDCVLQELTPDGEVVFEWNTWDHMILGENSGGLSQQDYAHLNSVALDDDGNWLVSARHMSQVLKIDRSTGEVIWRLGGVSSDFTFVNDPLGGLCGQHTASRLSNGNILVFDNGFPCVPDNPERGEVTRASEYALDLDAMTAELVWSYQSEDGMTRTEGSAQRLGNGNTFIGWGTARGKIASEVDPSGAIVFDLSATSLDGTVRSYRARRFPD